MAETQEMFESLLEIVSCPVCFERLRPPTMCCINGHAICIKCKEELIKCPICYGKFSEEKHTTLSQILEALPYICKFKDCSALTTDIEHHEKWCGFRPTACKRCDWTGPASYLRTHVEEEHHLRDIAVENTHYIDQDITWGDARVQYGQMFWDIRKHDVKKKRFSIQFIWIPNGEIKEELFQMKIEFESKDSSYVATKRVKFDPNKESEDTNCFVFHTDMLKPYTKKLDVSYKLYLLKK